MNRSLGIWGAVTGMRWGEASNAMLMGAGRFLKVVGQHQRLLSTGVTGSALY